MGDLGQGIVLVIAAVALALMVVVALLHVMLRNIMLARRPEKI